MKNKYPHLSAFSNDLIEEYRIYLEHSCPDRYMRVKSLQKFVRGRMEHEETDIMKIDCDYEIQQELIDIDAYEFIKRVQRRIREENPITRVSKITMPDGRIIKMSFKLNGDKP